MYTQADFEFDSRYSYYSVLGACISLQESHNKLIVPRVVRGDRDDDNCWIAIHYITIDENKQEVLGEQISPVMHPREAIIWLLGWIFGLDSDN